MKDYLQSEMPTPEVDRVFFMKNHLRMGQYTCILKSEQPLEVQIPPKN